MAAVLASAAPPAAAVTSGSGYWLVARDGGIFSFGGGAFHGATGGMQLNQPIVGMAPHPSGNGYWFVAADGGVFAFGESKFFGSMGGQKLNQPIVGMAAHPSGNGYWLVARDGGIFGFGAAGFHGSTGSLALNQPIVGMTAHPSGNGYWFVAADGGIFGFGEAKFLGSMAGSKLNHPVVGMAAHPSGNGYWLVARDGGIFSFGDAKFHGSTGGIKLNEPIVGMASHPSGNGYWFVAADGGIFGFGEAKFVGSMGGQKLNHPVVGMAGTPEPTKPSVIVDQAASQEDPTDESAVDFTVTFSEPVAGFTAQDVVAGGTAGGTRTVTVTGGPTTYNVAVSGMTTDGTVTASVPAGAAHDAAYNGNTASTSTDNAVAYDNSDPSATVAKAADQEEPTHDSPVDFTVTFSEDVTGFTGSDVVAGGSSGGTKTATVTGGPRMYNVAVSGATGTGTVTAAVPAGAVIDVAGNANTVSNTAAVAFDEVDPTVTVTKAAGQLDPTNASPVDFTVVFSEAVTGFAPSDVSTADSTAPGMLTAAVTGGPTTYNVAVSGMTGNGDVTVTVPAGGAADAAGNTNTVSTVPTDGDNTVAFDNASPGVTSLAKADGQADPARQAPVRFTVTFDEVMSGFGAETSDVTLGGLAAHGGSFVVTPGTPAKTFEIAVSGVTGTGNVTVAIPAGAGTDPAGNPNTASSAPASVQYDDQPPTFDSISATGGSQTVVATFSGPVLCSTVQPSDFGAAVAGTGTVVSGASCTGTTDATIDLTLGTAPKGGEAVSVEYGGNATPLTDEAGNEVPRPQERATTATSDFAVTVAKRTAPVESPQADPTNTGPIEFTVVFSRAVAGNSFTPADVTVGGTAPGTKSVTVNSTDQQTFTVGVSGMSPNTTGDVTISIAAGKANDATGNLNSASVPNGDAVVAYDNEKPRVTGLAAADGQSNPTKDSPVNFKVTFSEPVNGFDTADLIVDGSADEEAESGVVITAAPGTGTVFNVAVEATGNGTVTLAIAAGGASDAAGNTNSASSGSPASVTLDTTRPTATISPATGQSDPTNEASIEFKVQFTEPVFNLANGDFTVSGAANPAAKTLTATADPAVYTVAVTGMTGDGAVVLTLLDSGANDQAGNQNETATGTITRDTARPAVTITHPGQADPTNGSSVSFVVTFDKVVTGFGTSDLVFTGAATTSPSISGERATTPAHDYTVTVTVTGEGPVTLTVPQGGATDAAGNTNAASTSPAANTPDGDNVVTRDTTRPTVTVSKHALQTEDPTDEAQIEFAVVFNEVVTGFDNTDVAVSGAGAGAPAPGDVTGSGTTYKVVVSGMTPATAGSVQLAVNDNAAADAATNLSRASTTPGVVAFDDVDPVFGSIVSHAGSPKVVAAFDEALLCSTVATTDFIATIGGSATTVTAVACTGTSDDTIELTLSHAPAAAQSVAVTLTGSGSVTDRAGNSAAPTTRTATATPLTVTVAKSATQENPTDENEIEFTITFSEPVSGLTASEVTVAAEGNETKTLTPTTGPAQTYTLTVKDMSDGDVTVSVPAGVAQDSDNTSNEASTTSATVTRETVPPQFQNITAPEAGTTTVDANFSEALNCTTVAAGDFAVKFTTALTDSPAPATVNSVQCAGSVVTLTLATPIPPATIVEVTLAGTVEDTVGNVSATGVTREAAATPPATET